VQGPEFKPQYCQEKKKEDDEEKEEEVSLNSQTHTFIYLRTRTPK
jgi:hypothetical protein